jgi:hypothetical protein
VFPLPATYPHISIERGLRKLNNRAGGFLGSCIIKNKKQASGIDKSVCNLGEKER